MAVSGGKLTSVRLDDETYAMAIALAEANFRKPSGEGHLAGLLRALIHQAYRHPERFGMLLPSSEQGQPPAPSSKGTKTGA